MSDRVPRRPRRRGLLVLAALVATMATGTVGAGPAEALDAGLAVESHAHYVIDAAGGPVRVSVTMTLRNRTVDTAGWSYYYDAFGLPVPAGATAATATSDGRALTVRVEDTEDPTTQLARVTFAPLYQGRSRTIEWSYLIPGAPVRSANLNRVGPGYASFFVQAVGDPGQVSAEVVAPTSMKVDTSDGDFLQRPDGDVVRYVTETSTNDDGIWAVVSARDPHLADQDVVTVGGTTITLDSFPGDTAWAQFVSAHVTEGMPVLERIVGMPWPGGLESIREDVAPRALRYAWFDSVHDDIVVSEDLDADTLYHEMGHAWFDYGRFTDRWLAEGLTEVVAQRVVTETDGNPTPRPTPDRAAPAAVPLTAWSVDDWGAFDVEEYAYGASFTAMSELLNGLDEKTFAAVVSAAYAGESGYEPAGSKAETSSTIDWRRFLDLVEDRGGVTSAEQTYRTWVVTPDEAAELDDRAAARTEYARVDDADGAWLPPLGLRRAMTAWDFRDAGQAVAALGEAPEAAAAVAAAATAARLPVPHAAREAYESAASTTRYGELAPLLHRTATVMPAVAEARDAAASGRDPFSWVGQTVLGVDDVAADAQAELARGDVEAAAASAARATARASAATWAGGVCVALLLGVFLGATALVVAHQRWSIRVRTVPPGPVPYPPEAARRQVRGW
ncbi:hypothetical protein ET495_13940 [Xylanimonas allomyrinae]|uniref:Peptidase M1 membrane alanine aminopeptidase domain-containing protein n=1 Tax=Xylanimonas allomyrinae TaxID=2509459 RepID=A0A4P6ENQ8_9MICO|nr:hypothetical protein [Xylanimonas allomyrinae]QAY64135.1 hypothetical protein ET495_13940 [Xylanimonas allomyrinae]